MATTQKKATAKKATSKKKVTAAKDWKGGRRSARELTLPSENVCLVRNPGMQHFLRANILPNGLKQWVLDAINDKGSKDLSEAVKNEQELQEVFEAIDRIVIECVVEPKVHPIPTDEDGNDIPWEEREDKEEKIYIDDVEEDDKIFIFQFAVGGTSDVESFRAEQEATMESLRSGKGLEV